MEARESKKRNVENKPILSLTCTLRCADSAVKTRDHREPLSAVPFDARVHGEATIQAQWA